MHKFDGQRAYDFLSRLNYQRPSGSEAEARAARQIQAELAQLGLQAEIHEFPVPAYQEHAARVEFSGRSLPAAVVGLTGSTGAEGVSGELVYIETGEEEFLIGIEGKIALLYGFVMGTKKYERIAKAKPKAVICIGEAGKELTNISVWDTYPKRFGQLPSVAITYQEGLQLLKEGAGEVRVICDQEQAEGSSQNIILDIPGSSKQEDVIVVCAHYDTVPATTGSQDNGGGSAIVAELARIFTLQPPRTNLRFIWFGAEELGLLGSWHYVDTLSDEERDKIKLVLNIDVAGGIIGRNSATITGPDNLKAYAEVLGKELGLGLSVRGGVSSSDGLPFGDKGIPSLNLARYGGATTYMHTKDDSLEHIDAAHLKMLGDYAEEFLCRITNAKAFPFEREIPETIKKEINKYKEESEGKEKEEKK